MDRYTLSTASLNAHRVEIYTGTLVIRGMMLGPFQRTSDLVNRRDRENLIVEEATLAPLGQNVAPKPITDPIFVARSHIHLVAALPTPENITDPYLSGPLTPAKPAPSGPLAARGLTNLSTPAGSQRQSHVARVPRPCYVFTATFVVSGICHLLQGSTIENLLDAQDPFFPLTQAIMYLHANPTVTWRLDLALVNKGTVQAVYTTDPRPAQPQADAPRP
ncbi:MAG: hypothetical protein WCD37_09810 [Chloroflexia bacterium]